MSKKLTKISIALLAILSLNSFVNAEEVNKSEKEETKEINKKDKDSKKETSKENKMNDGGPFISIGASMLNTNSLNTFLEDSNFTQINNIFMSYKYGFNTEVYKGIVIGSEGYYLWGKESKSESKQVSVEGSAAFFNLGYSVNLGDFQIMPLLGIGGGGVKLNKAPNEKTETTFSDFLDKDSQFAEINSHSLLLNPSLSIKYTNKMTFGIKAGYVLAPFGTKWEANNTRFTESPTEALSGPYVHLTISR